MNWRKQLLIIVLIFLFGGSFQYFFFCRSCFDSYEQIMGQIVFSGLIWAGLWKGSEFWVNLLDRYSVSWIKAPVQRLIYTLLTVVLYVIFLYYLIYILIVVIILDYDFLPALQAIEVEDYMMPLIVTVGINVVMHGRGFLLSLRQQSIDNEKLKTEHVASQLISLKDQVNPHFLFNSLNALSSLVYDDQKKAVKFIRKLSDVYRYVLDQTDKELVTLDEELKFMESYFYLMKIRFEENLVIDLEGITDNLKLKNIPPMSIQLLVENAIKHNVVSASRPLNIHLFTNESGFLVVKNNVSPKKTNDSKGIGLNNLRMRYRFLSDKQMIINHTEKVFEVYLPLLEIEG
jgi:sensor histidine kinase YesM